MFFIFIMNMVEQFFTALLRSLMTMDLQCFKGKERFFVIVDYYFYVNMNFVLNKQLEFCNFR